MIKLLSDFNEELCGPCHLCNKYCIDVVKISILHSFNVLSEQEIFDYITPVLAYSLFLN